MAKDNVRAWKSNLRRILCVWFLVFWVFKWTSLQSWGWLATKRIPPWPPSRILLPRATPQPASNSNLAGARTPGYIKQEWTCSQWRQDREFKISLVLSVPLDDCDFYDFNAKSSESQNGLPLLDLTLGWAWTLALEPSLSVLPLV